MTYLNLVENLVKKKRLKTSEIVSAFKKVDRANFMRPEDKNQADVDTAFPIGEDQTISQPSTVAIMIELLQPHKGQKILDIGSGSGWTTAILAEIVGDKGKIFSVEIIDEIYKFGKKNIQKLKYKNIEFLNKDASGGLPEYAPFDRILASASSPEIPKVLKEQLNLKGRLVMPVKDTIVMLERISKDKFKKSIHPYFAFVPMKGKYGVK